MPSLDCHQGWRMAPDRTSIIQITALSQERFDLTQHLFFAIALIATGVLFNSAAEANSFNSLRCEDRAANCVGTCANHGGGVNDNHCGANARQHVSDMWSPVGRS